MSENTLIQAPPANLRRMAAIAPSLHWRYSGVTSTIIALVRRQAISYPIAALGPFMPADVPQITFKQILRDGWSHPPGRDARVWHARRNDEMIVGLLLKYVLRQPWKLLFTSAAQRRHTRFTRWLLRQMDDLIATSEGAAGFLELPSTVIHHGVDMALFHPAENRAAEWQETGLNAGFIIGAFGRLRPQKGTDLLIEAMLRLMPKYPEVVLVLTGLVTPEHEVFVAGLKARITAAGLSERIHFLGERPREEMPLWFRRINLYVAPMRSEGFGLTPLEAMASGAAVVATRTGAASYLVAQDETGLLVPPDDLEALVDAIETVVANPSRAESMGRLGRAKAVQQHDIAQEAARIIEVYEKLLT